MENGRNCSLGAISPLIHNILLPDVRFYVQKRTRFSLRDKRLFEITKVEITRVKLSLICIRQYQTSYKKGYKDNLEIAFLIFSIKTNIVTPH